MTRLLTLAERRGVGVDLHVDERLDGPVTLLDYALAVRDRQPGTSLSAGHCVRLGTLTPAELAPVIKEVLASDLGIITLPITNLYLQGWQHPISTPRGLTSLDALLAAGARLGAGADNVRDPFNPIWSLSQPMPSRSPRRWRRPSGTASRSLPATRAPVTTVRRSR